MGFEIGVADHVVKGERAWANNIAKVCVHHTALRTALKPPCHKRDHGVRFSAVAGETADEIGAFARLGAVAGDEPGNDLVVLGRDEDLDVLWVCGDVAFREIEEGVV